MRCDTMYYSLSLGQGSWFPSVPLGLAYLYSLAVSDQFEFMPIPSPKNSALVYTQEKCNDVRKNVLNDFFITPKQKQTKFPSLSGYFLL